VIDTSAVGVVATIPVGNIPEGLAVDPSGTRLYVANSGPNSVSVVDTASNTVVKTIDVGLTPFSVALRPDGARLFVINRGGGSVSVVDTAANVVTATVPVGFGPTGMGQFTLPPLRVPSFGPLGRKCQVTLLKQAIKLVKLQHQLEAACRLGKIKAEAAGTGTSAADAACQKTLDVANAGSRLASARLKLAATVTKACGSVVPRQIDGPCVRDALGFAATIGCVISNHSTRVQAMVDDEFGPTHPVPLAPGPLACQSTLTRSARTLAARFHKELGSCLEKLLLAVENGKGEAKVVTTCLAKLDLTNPASKAAIARAKALAAIGKKCVTVTPADIGSPCKPAAANCAQTASCVIDDHVSDVGKLIAAEVNDSCSMVTRLGLGLAFPSICSGAE
jgi:YVTN family beta-propeller protein